MKTGIRDFCVNYNKKLKNDKDIKENEMFHLDDYRERIRFRLNMIKSTPSTYKVGGFDTGTIVFDLDDEDLKYLYDKYSKRCVEEMEENIKKIKDQYEEL